MNANELQQGQGFIGYMDRAEYRQLRTRIVDGLARLETDGSKVVVVLITPYPSDSITRTFYREFHEKLPPGHEHQFASGTGLWAWVSGVRDKRSKNVKLDTLIGF